MKIQAIAAAAAFVLMSSVASAQVTMEIISTTGGDPLNLAVGEFVNVGVIMRNPTMSSIQGLGLSIHDYDEAVADFVSGMAVDEYLFETIIPGTGCFGGLASIAGGDLVESAIGDNGNRVQIANSAGLSMFTVTGEGDCGLDGITNDAAQFEFTFEAIGEGTTTLIIGTGYEGDAVVLAGGVQADAVNETLTITVPEPGALAAGIVSLGSVFGLAGIRRRI